MPCSKKYLALKSWWVSFSLHQYSYEGIVKVRNGYRENIDECTTHLNRKKGMIFSFEQAGMLL